MDNDTYLFHQTPKDCAKDLIARVPLVAGDRVIEPFKGEGAFYDAFPDYVSKDWAELTKGRDYTSLTDEFDWVITNPPFKLDTGGKRVNSFWFILDYYTTRAKKGIAFLGNDYCLSSLTPIKLKILEDRGWKITKLVVTAIKKWRGRYFFIILEKQGQSCLEYLSKTY